MSRVSLVGLPAVRAALQRAKEIGEGPKLLGAIGDELHRALLHVQSVAQAKTPRDTGVLEASAETPTPRISGDGIEARITYGGMASKYAEAQHENDDWQHPKKGQSHFLFGSADAAWEQELPETMDTLDRAVEEIANDYLTP